MLGAGKYVSSRQHFLAWNEQAISHHRFLKLCDCARDGGWRVVAQQTGGVCVRVAHKQADVEVPQGLSRHTQPQVMALNSGWVEGGSICLSGCEKTP